MKNLLFVSIAFPPKNDPECLQTAKYFKYLVKDNSLNIDVVTSEEPTLFMPVDENLRVYDKGYRTKVKLHIYENKYVNFLIRKLNKGLLQQPDSKFTFSLGAKRVFKELENKPDVIYSRSFPMSSTFLASKIQKKYNVPWVLHLSDPWIGSPFHKVDSELEKKLKRKEFAFVKQASYVCLTSEKTVMFYKSKYPDQAKKFILFPNVFDPDDIQDEAYRFNKKLRFVYTGGLTDKRSPENLFKALKNIYLNDSKVLDNIEFIFAGQFDRQNEMLFSQYKLPCVKNKGLLSYKDALKLQQSADVLLVIDTPMMDVKNAMFFPSKLLDYFIAKRRILALTDVNSTTYDVIKSAVGSCLEHNNIKGIQEEVLRIITEWNAKNLPFFYTKEVNEKFSAEYNVNRLKKLFKGINEKS